MAEDALPCVLGDAQRSALEAAYAEPPRAYHNFQHVDEVLRHYREVATGPGWMQPREVALAVLYHDAIYQPGRSDNESRSARFAVEQLEQWQPQSGIDAQRVAYLIELTARHGQFAPVDFDGDRAPDDVRRFLDCDMAILGAKPAVFDAYDRGIAAEYRGTLPGWLFRLGRRRFLRALLARERIFLSGFFHSRLDAQARANLRRAVNEKR
jgi:predicted metal-dependent HD superfamily phosphohydrolase